MPGKSAHTAAYGMLAVSALLLWSALKGKKWTSSLRDLIGGQSPVSATGTPITSSSVPATGPGSDGNVPAAPITLAKNQATGKILAAGYGWIGTEWDALYNLWQRESIWNNYAYNPSGATGIPQSLPYSKMPRAAWLPSQGGLASAAAQIQWGLGYIKSRYGSPSAAWAHEQSAGWY